MKHTLHMIWTLVAGLLILLGAQDLYAEPEAEAYPDPEPEAVEPLPPPQEEAPPLVVEPVVEPVATPATTSAPPPAVVVEPEKPVVTPQKPARRGEELRAAFKDVRASKFSVVGKSRVFKIPDKKAKRQKGDDSWRRTLEFGISTTRGNSDTLRYDGSLSARKECDKNFYWLKMGGRYGESEGQTDAENAYGEGKYERSLSERMYASVDGHVLHDQIAALAYRARGNLSLGRHFIWTERTVLSVEAGPGYVREKKGGLSEGFMAGRVAQYAEWLVNSSVLVWQSVEYIPNLEDTAIYFMNAEVGLETVLLPNLSLKFVLQDRYDSSPAEGKKSNDLMTTTSLNWSF